MVRRNKDQGTEWETQTVKDLKAIGYQADRIAEAGQNDRGDVEAYQWGSEVDAEPMVVLFWKRLVRKPGQKRRVPDGERDVVVLRKEDFLRLIHPGKPQRLIVECKATEHLNVTRTLHKAIRKATRETTND